MKKFPKGFLWGSATSSYQVEGGIDNCDWSKEFPAGRACDHYHLYEKDFDLVEELNQNVHRFSIEWSRIEPEKGRFDEEEIEHYREVLKSLDRRGIKTMVTLHHFTNPQWVADEGGWKNRKVVDYFVRYSKKMISELDDLVDFWVTINEPFVIASGWHIWANWPPQERNLLSFVRVVLNQIRAHNRIYGETDQMGIVKNNSYLEPLSNSWLDKLTTKIAHYFVNEYFLNRVEFDFIGLNYYFHARIKFPGKQDNENKVVSDLGWEIYPEGIYHVLKDLDKYGKPIYITENGLADKNDDLRKRFIKNHLLWTHRAIEEGVDVRGYLHWSLMDNFEWAEGFEPRFGLIEIDYETLERKVRDSARYYSQIAKNNAVA